MLLKFVRLSDSAEAVQTKHESSLGVAVQTKLIGVINISSVGYCIYSSLGQKTSTINQNWAKYICSQENDEIVD